MKTSISGAIGNARSRSAQHPGIALALGVVLLLPGAARAQSAELPDGPGKALLLENCTACHGSELITMRRRSPEEWAQVVNRMIGNGASLTDDQYKEAVAYLGTYLAKDATGQPAADAKAKAK